MVLFDETLIEFRGGGDLAIHRCEIKARTLGGSSEMITLVPSRYSSAPDQFRNFADERESAAFLTRIDAQPREPMDVGLMRGGFLSLIHHDRIGARPAEG